jgi:hypothetical protein
MADFDQRCGADSAHGADQFNGEFVGHFDHIEQDAVAFPKRRRILDKQASELRVTRVGHRLRTRKLAAIGFMSSRFSSCPVKTICTFSVAIK